MGGGGGEDFEYHFVTLLVGAINTVVYLGTMLVYLHQLSVNETLSTYVKYLLCQKNKNYIESTYLAVSVVLGFKRDMSVWLFPERVESLLSALGRSCYL